MVEEVEPGPVRDKVSSPTTRLLEPGYPNLSLARRIAIFSVAVVNVFAQYLYFTMPLSFLANEVIEKRNLSSSVAGGVFGALCLSLCLTLISAPKTSSLLTVRQALAICILMILPSTALYIVDIPDTWWVMYSYLSRILQGIAIGITDVRFLDMMTLVFPNKVSLVTSSYEIAFSISLMTGPELGGYLYEVYGFWAPLNLATLITVTTCLMAFVCTYSLQCNEQPEQEMSPSFRDLFHFPLVVLGMSVMCVISITVTVVESFFSNYMLNKYGLTETQSGWAMTVAGLFYTIATFASGFIGTRNQNLKYLIVGGLALMGVSACLLGEDFGYLQQMGYYWPAAMYSVMEIGSGLTQVAVLPLLVEHYKNKVTLPENTASCHMGGVYSSSFFLGSFLGPIIGGFALRFTTFRGCCTISGVLLIAEMVVVLGCNLRDRTLLSPWTQSPDVMQTVCDN